MKYWSLRIFFVVFLFLGFPNSLFLQTAPPVVQAPKTPAGQQLAKWLAVFETGDQEAFAKFIADNYDKSLLDQDTPVDRADRQARVYLDVRKFEIRTIESSTPTEVVALARARLTDLWYRLTLKVQTASPHRIVEYSSQRIAPPESSRIQRPGQSQILKEVRSFIDRLAANDAFSGTVLVARDGKPILTMACGLASKAYNAPIRNDTRFNIASIGKAFTAVAIMQLVEEGKISLTDKLAKYLPDYPDKAVADKVTIRNLLSHSSGLGDFHGPEYAARAGTLREVKDYFALFDKDEKPLSFEPGEKMQYSNIGYILLGAIIEKVTGQSYFDYIQERIFKPSGMTDTAFLEADVDSRNVATGYTNFKDLGNDYHQFVLGQRRNTSRYGVIKGNPQGGVFSTAVDLLRFANAFRSHRLVSAKSSEQMTASKYFFRRYAAEDVYYGYGFELQNVHGKRVIGHGGGDLGVSTVMRWYPDSGNYTVVILSNYDRGGIVAIDRIQQVIIEGH